MPKIPLRYFLLIAALAILVINIQFGALVIAFEKLDLSPDSALLLFLTILGGSLINLPLFSVKSDPPKMEDTPPKMEDAPPRMEDTPPRMEDMPPLREIFSQVPHTGKTIVMVNVGGCVVPSAFSLYLLVQHPLNVYYVVLAVAAVALLCFKIARPLPGIGLSIPMLLAPLMAALVSVALDPANAAPLAFVSGTLGVLIGADLLHLGDIRRLGTPFASIGGAGSFDGIFISGLVAVLLA